MRARANLLLLFSICSACSNGNEENANSAEIATKTEIEFDKTKWRTMGEGDYPYRNEMLEDLMSNHKLKGLKREEVLDLLGQPDRTDSSYLFYLVAQKRIYFFPLHTKTLVIKLSIDSTVEWRKIHQ